ncbi:uncharacterized protein LJ206_007488 isoform 3-T4 [Theristicus caerulescens]
MAKRCHSVNGLFLAPCCCRTKLQRKANSITADDAGEPTVSAVTSAFVPPSGPRERASTRPALQFHRLSSQPGATVQPCTQRGGEKDPGTSVTLRAWEQQDPSMREVV